jgi:hypothetical protein
VEHRHLLPDEFDLLLDGELGFGVTPLRAHVRRCADCRAELAAQRAAVTALEQIPHFSPSASFAERVMANVQVFEPAHVAATETARRWLPESRPARVFIGALAACVAFIISAGALWSVAQVNRVVALSGPAGDRLQVAVMRAVGGLAAGALGRPTAEALAQSGPSAVALAIIALLAAVAVAAVGLRALAVSARRRRV